MDRSSRLFIRAIRGTGPLNWNLAMKMMAQSECRNALPQLDTLLDGWNWDRFVMCHGQIAEKDARHVFREASHK